MTDKKKIIRTATVPMSLDLFCRGLFRELSGSYEMIALSSPMPELEILGCREGVRTIAVPMKRKIAPFSDLVSLFRQITVFRKERPDMVHSITPKAGLLSMLAAKMARVPVRVHTFTGLVSPYQKGLKRRLLMTTDRVTADCATHVIPEGEGVKDDLLRLGITRKPLRVLGNGSLRGIDLGYFARTDALTFKGQEIRKDLGIPGSDFVFIFVGRLDKDKGIDNLVQAFTQLENEYPDIHLLLVGEEEAGDAAILETTREAINASERIHLSNGWQEDTRPWYAAADALVHPSFREGFPNVVIEAGAMELPAIVTDINGSREIIIEGENGIIVNPGDTDALLQAMRQFAGHRKELREMGLRARRLCDRYEQKYVWHCTEDFYKEVLS